MNALLNLKIKVDVGITDNKLLFFKFEKIY